MFFPSAFLSYLCPCLFLSLNYFASPYVAPSRKRGREASSTAAVAVEAALAESTVVETASSERPRKRDLLDLSKDEDEEEAHSVVVSETPPMTDEAAVEEEVAAGEPGAEEAAVAEAMIEVAAAEVVVEEEAIAEVTEALDAEAASTEAPAAEEAAEDISDDEVSAMGLPQAAPVEVSSAASAERTLVVTAPTKQPPSAPLRLRGIVFRSDSTVVTELAVVEAAATGAPSLQPVSSAALTELVVVDVPGAPSAAEDTPSFDDLEELYASLHEEGGSSAPAPLDEDSKAVAEKLREFLFFGVHQMTSAEAFLEFRSCLDTAMAMGLLDSAQLDELQARLAEGEEMIGRYAEVNMRMTEGCSLEQELLAKKELVQPTMTSLKENDLVVQRENEELAQVEAQIAELQVRQGFILQRRDLAVAAGAELKSSARHILKAATEKKKALVERKLIQARWQADIDGGDIAWRRITCLI
ncbi:unnamed protein product [Prunus armeniaca]